MKHTFPLRSSPPFSGQRDTTPSAEHAPSVNAEDRPTAMVPGSVPKLTPALLSMLPPERARQQMPVLETVSRVTSSTLDTISPSLQAIISAGVLPHSPARPSASARFAAALVRNERLSAAKPLPLYPLHEGQAAPHGYIAVQADLEDGKKTRWVAAVPVQGNKQVDIALKTLDGTSVTRRFVQDWNGQVYRAMGRGVLGGAPAMLSEAQKQADMEHVFSSVSHYQQNVREVLNWKAAEREYKRTLSDFVYRMHRGEKLIYRENSEEATLTYPELKQAIQKYSTANGLSGYTQRVFDVLADTLYAREVQALIPHFRQYLAQERRYVWEETLSDKAIYTKTNNIIQDVFKLNRYMLLHNLPPLDSWLQKTRESDEATCDRRIAELASLLEKAECTLSSMTEFIAFYVKGAENYVPTAPSTREESASAPPASALNNTRVAEVDAWEKRKVTIQKKMFSDGNASLNDKKSKFVLQPNPEQIELCCVGGQGERQYYWYHEWQLNMNCGVHALNSFIVRTYDLAHPPLILGDGERPEPGSYRHTFELNKWAWEEEHGREYSDATVTEEEWDALRAKTLQDMGGARAPMSNELYEHLTDHLCQYDSKGQRLPGSEVQQLLYCLRLLGQPVVNIPITGGRQLTKSRDWQFLAQAINNTGGSCHKYLIFRPPYKQEQGHYYTYHRTEETREWSLVDSLNFDQPQKKPARYHYQELRHKNVPHFEMLIPVSSPAPTAIGTQMNRALSFYKHVLCSAKFSDAAAALEAFSGVDVGTFVLHQFLSNGPDALYSDSEPVLDFEMQSDRRINVDELCSFVKQAVMHYHNEAAPVEKLIYPWKQHRPMSENVQSLKDMLNGLGESAGNVLLGGWVTQPYFLVVRKEESGQWRLGSTLKGKKEYKGATLEECFLGNPAAQPPLPPLIVPSNEDPIETIELMALSPHYPFSSRVNLKESVRAASTHCMQSFVKHVDNAEAGLGNGIARRGTSIASSYTVGRSRSQSVFGDGDSLLVGDGDPSERRSATSELTLPQTTKHNPQERAAIYGGAAAGIDLNEDGLRDTTHRQRAAAQISTRRLAMAFHGESYISRRPQKSSSDGPPFKRAQLDREQRQHVTDKPIARVGTLAETMRRPDWTIAMSDAVAEGIVADFTERATTDGRFSHLLNEDALLQTVRQSITPAFEHHLREYSHHILRLVAATHVLIEDAHGSMVPHTLPILIRVKFDHDNKQVHILEMHQSSREKLDEMQSRLGHNRWKARVLHLEKPVAERIIQNLREDSVDDALNGLNDHEVLRDAVQQALLREGDDRPVRLRPTLWRLVVALGGQDIPVLVILRGSERIQKIVRDNDPNREDMLEEVRWREQRQKRVVQRIWQRDLLSGGSIAQLRESLNDNDEEVRYSPFDVVQMLASPEDLEEDMAPFKKLVVQDEGGIQVGSYLILFEDDELIDMAEESDENRRALQEFQLDGGLGIRLKAAAAMRNEEYEGEDSDGGFGRLALALERDREAQDLDSIDEVIAQTVVRGTGKRIHPDYPDLKQYEINLTDEDEGLSPRQVLIRIHDYERVMEILPDSPPNRQTMLAYHLRPQDIQRILTLDRKQKLDGLTYGPLIHLAGIDYLEGGPEGEEIDMEHIDHAPVVAGFLRKVIVRDKGRVVDPDYPEIAAYKTGLHYLQDGQERPLYLLARVRQSAVIDVRLCNLKNFLNMALHKTDPGPYLEQVKNLLGEAFSSDSLLQIIHPDRRSLAPREGAAPAWHLYWDGSIHIDPLLAEVHDRTVLTIASNDEETWNQLAAYRIPVEHCAHILRFGGRLLKRLKAPGQNIWEYALASIVRGRGMPYPGWPQLHQFQVPSTEILGAEKTLLVRIENNEIWGIYDGTDEKILEKVQRWIQNDLVLEGMRISRAEQRRLQTETVDHVVAVLREREQNLNNPELREQLSAQHVADNMQRIARREFRNELSQWNLPEDLRTTEPTTLAAFGDDVFELINQMVREGQWEPIPGHRDMQRCAIGEREGMEGNWFIYGYFDGDYPVDVHLGKEENLALLISKRREWIQQVPDIPNSLLSHQEIQNVYMRDRYLRNGVLMALADSDLRTLVEFLSRTIPVLTVRNGYVHSTLPSELVRTGAGEASELFRRCLTDRKRNGREVQLYALYTTDAKALSDPNVKIRLQDVWIVPDENRPEGFVLSSSLQAQCRFLERFARDITLPPLERQADVSFSSSSSGGNVNVNNDIPVMGALAQEGDFNLNFMDIDGQNQGMPDFDGQNLSLIGLGGRHLGFMDLDEQNPGLMAGPGGQNLGFMGGGEQNPDLMGQDGQNLNFMGLGEQNLDLMGLDGQNLNFMGLDEQNLNLMGLDGQHLDFMGGGGQNPVPLPLDFGGPNSYQNFLDAVDITAEMVDRDLFEEVMRENQFGDGTDEENHGDVNIYSLNRIEYDDEEINRLWNEMQSLHGDSMDRLRQLLAPNRDVLEWTSNFLGWIEKMAQPQRESLVTEKYPQIKRITTTWLDKSGKPVSFLAEVDGDRIGIPWGDTKENEKKLLQEAERKSATPAPASDNEVMLLDADAARAMAASVMRLNGRQLDAIAMQLLADIRGADVLTAIYDKGGKVDSLEEQRERLRAFLEEALAIALEGRSPSSVRVLSIATGVIDVGGKEVMLGISLSRRGGTKVWIRDNVKRERGNEDTKVKQELEHERIRSSMPRVRKTQRTNTGRKQTAQSQANPGQKKKKVRFDDEIMTEASFVTVNRLRAALSDLDSAASVTSDSSRKRDREDEPQDDSAMKRLHVENENTSQMPFGLLPEGITISESWSRPANTDAAPFVQEYSVQPVTTGSPMATDGDMKAEPVQSAGTQSIADEFGDDNVVEIPKLSQNRIDRVKQYLTSEKNSCLFGVAYTLNQIDSEIYSARGLCQLLLSDAPKIYGKLKENKELPHAENFLNYLVLRSSFLFPGDATGKLFLGKNGNPIERGAMQLKLLSDENLNGYKKLLDLNAYRKLRELQSAQGKADEDSSDAQDLMKLNRPKVALNPPKVESNSPEVESNSPEVELNPPEVASSLIKVEPNSPEIANLPKADLFQGMEQMINAAVEKYGDMLKQSKKSDDDKWVREAVVAIAGIPEERGHIGELEITDIERIAPTLVKRGEYEKLERYLALRERRRQRIGGEETTALWISSRRKAIASDSIRRILLR